MYISVLQTVIFLFVLLLYSVSVFPLGNVHMLSDLGTKHTQILETAAATCQTSPYRCICDTDISHYVCPRKKKHGIHITSTCTIAIMTPWYLIDTQVWYFYSCNSVIPRSNKNIISASQFQSIFKQTVHIINLRKKIINKSDIVSIQEVSMYMYWF